MNQLNSGGGLDGTLIKLAAVKGISTQKGRGWTQALPSGKQGMSAYRLNNAYL
jgi:hypothetical protein